MTSMKNTSRLRRRSKRPLPYRARTRLITASELRFLQQGLVPAVGGRFAIAAQVSLSSVITVDAELWDKAPGRRISQKRLDFVLVYPKSYRIAAAIELDDRSHERDHRSVRDRFVGDALAAAGVLLIRIPVYRAYDSKRIRSIIYAAIRRHRAEQRGVVRGRAAA